MLYNKQKGCGNMKLQKTFPSVVKYMGSKTEVLDLIEKGFNFFKDDEHKEVCDLFAGSATLSAALRNKTNVISNDVQMYSSIFASVYLENYEWSKYPDITEISDMAYQRVKKFNDTFLEYKNKFDYNRELTLSEMNIQEEEQRKLIEVDKWGQFDEYYLFTKCYSGTYWSYDQCVLIDSYKSVIDKFKDDKVYYNLLLACLIYAMAYNSQSTGHYAQYRIPENNSSKEDILIYRRKNITDFFERKYNELKNFLREENAFKYQTMAETDVNCLEKLPEHTLVYADPPYCFVHYSRFYHIIETLVKYDYPKVKFKGRYRTDRYQSKYCKKTNVKEAFEKMFKGIVNSKSDLILSYTNSSTNTIIFEDLLSIFCNTFNPNGITEEMYCKCKERCENFFKDQNQEIVTILSCEEIRDKGNYEIAMIKKSYNHSRMGRTNSKTIPVTEIVLIAKYIK